MSLVDSSKPVAEKEESVEELIRKLSQKGTKVKILKEGEADSEIAATPQ